MSLNLFYLIELLEEEYAYLNNLVSTRYRNQDLVLDEPISSIAFIPDNNRSAFEIGRHGMQPLFINCKKLLKAQNKPYEKFELYNSGEKQTISVFMEMFQSLLEIANLSLREIDPSSLEGDFSRFADEPEKLKQRFHKLTTHVIHHLGQVTLVLGSIKDNLDQS